MSQQSSWVRLFARRLLFAVLLLLVPLHPCAAQRAIPDPGLPLSYNPLCSGSLVPCLDIDDLAGHVYAHVQVLPRTDLRDTAAIFPFGVTMGLFGRLAGGISTYYAF